MALGFKLAHVQWNAADAVATEYSVSSLGFTPKFVRAYCAGLQAATTGATGTIDARASVGFAEVGGTRRSLAGYAQDAVSPTNCGSCVSDDCIISTIDGAGARTGLLDIAFDADGVRFIVDDQATNDQSVIVEIWGGSDITAVVLGDITEPAATGNQDYSATGMVAGATDQALFLAGGQTTAAINTAQANDIGMCVGFAHSAAEQVVAVANSDDASVAGDTDGYGLSGECLAQVVVGGGVTADARAAFVQWNSDGFRLNWLARATTGRRSFFAAVKGGQWYCGGLAIDITVVNNTATVSGIPFQPQGISFITQNSDEDVAGTTGTTGQLGLGCAASTSDRRFIAYRDSNTQNPSEIYICVRDDAAIGMVNNTAATRHRQDLDAITADGFRLIVDQANASDSAAWWDGFLAWADAPAVAGSDIPIGQVIS